MKRTVIFTLLVTILLGIISFVLLSYSKETLWSGANFEPHSVHFYNYPILMWLAVISNIAIGLAYFSIPFSLLYFIKKRKDVEFNWLFVLFSSFIFWCGIHHFVHVLTYWYPIYAVQASVDFVTAGVSLLTAVLLWRFMPKAIQLPKISEILNYNKELERRVEERTKALQQSEQQFRDLADSMPQLVWTAKSDGIVDYYNKKYKEFEGIKRSGKGYRWAPVLHPHDVEKTRNAWNDSLKEGSMYEVEHRIKLKKNGYRWFLTRAIPTTEKNGMIRKWYGTATDIDHRKKLEQQKDDFIGVASHELRTPVTSIKTYTHVLLKQFRQKEDMQSVEVLSKMNSQINRLTMLIGDLLDVTKIEAGKLQLRETYFDVNELINEVVEEMQLTTTRQKLITNLSQNTTLLGDRDRIGQVITNLLTNAIKYSPPHSEIIISTKQTKNELTISVQDFGIGIAKNKLRKVFDRFYRIEGHEQDTYPGLGLGLFISREIIERHGGSIWVESKNGEGSTFYFSLPINKSKTQT